MLKIFTTIIFFALFITEAKSFEPVYVETTDFKFWSSKQFPQRYEPYACRYEAKLNEGKNKIEITIGILGSSIDYFGWDVPLSPVDLPLKEGFRKEIKEPGETKMILTYKEGVLTWEHQKNAEILTRLYVFSLKIDPELSRPEKFEGKILGHDLNYFGRPKMHLKQNCNF